MVNHPSGEVSAEKIEIAEKLSAQHSKLMMNATTLADLLCETLPDLPSLHNLDDEDQDQSGANTGVTDVSGIIFRSRKDLMISFA